MGLRNRVYHHRSQKKTDKILELDPFLIFYPFCSFSTRPKITENIGMSRIVIEIKPNKKDGLLA